MEIFVKKHSKQMQRVHWFQSLPKKYQDEIVDQFSKSKVDNSKQYKVVLDILNQGELNEPQDTYRSGTYTSSKQILNDIIDKVRDKQKERPVARKKSTSPKRV